MLYVRFLLVDGIFWFLVPVVGVCSVISADHIVSIFRVTDSGPHITEAIEKNCGVYIGNMCDIWSVGVMRERELNGASHVHVLHS